MTNRPLEQHSEQPISRRVTSLSNVDYEAILGKDLKLNILNYDSQTLLLEWISNADTAFQSPIFSVLMDLLTTHSESYVMVTSRAAKSALEHSGLFSTKPITSNSIDKFLESQTPVGYQAMIRPLLRRLIEVDDSLFDDNCANLLRGDLKWEETKHYFRLMTNCPEGGALTDQELNNFQNALNRSFAEGKTTQFNFTLSWMCIGTGLRPIQIARMRRSDVMIHDGPEGKEVMLRVPLAKGEGLKNDYWLRRAPSVLAEALIAYLSSSPESEKSPLFYENSTSISNALNLIANSLDTWSDRLGAKIPITPYRFRYTLATRALAHGASDWEVARLLTHRSTSCIQFYRASMPELLNPIKSALGKEMAYFARAFQGKLIKNLSEATRKDDGEAEIMDFIHLTKGEALGACGTHAACYLNAPVACLSCSRFEPYKDAPWEELLDSLIQDSEKENEERIRLINLNAMSAIKNIIAERDKGVVNE